MTEYYVGLDVHSRESVFVIQQADGTVVARGSVPTDAAGFRALRDGQALPAGTTVALETGTVAFFAARQLAALELAPVVIDAHEVRTKASRPRQKSDRRDALELCEGIRRDLYRTRVYVPSASITQLRETLSRRRHFVRQQTGEVNATKRLLRGVGLGDILERGGPDWWAQGDGVDLDAFYRRCLSQGLVYHEGQGRGFLPAGLVEEIRALSQPPIPWDVELAQWFDEYFAPLEMMRSYARPSRRQSATPEIPRPRWVPAWGAEDGRTFGVVLDTSGSMDRDVLAKALGSIASYALSRDVPGVRVVFCDAAVYDQGYMPPEAIADRVKVKGRGGTVLQPGIDLLEAAEDFPKEGPLLIITDGWCDRLHIRRDHAFLIPFGGHLPFVPRGKVFRIQ